MKKIIRVLLLAFLIFVFLGAFIKTEQNGKSFWYNTGQQVKKVFVTGKDITKDAMSDLKDGLKE